MSSITFAQDEDIEHWLEQSVREFDIQRSCFDNRRGARDYLPQFKIHR
ncbi:MAG: hypothetical protein ICV63_14830 [Coleofasciculus sp. Co-bin14]|nr:hypothetical protein [Coleofasciculus sp. Co-bin14]